jgi:hypothetical protein
MEYSLFFWCVLSIAFTVASVPTSDYSVALSLHAALPIALTIVHFDGTLILSLHNILHAIYVETL